MGWRFRRSFRLLPGVRVNLSRRGPSFSVGADGITQSFGADGARTTIGLRGTGVFYSAATPYRRGVRLLLWIIGFAVLLILIFSG